MRTNDVKERLKRGGTAVGTMVFEFFVPGLPRLMAHTGADFAIYDMEHGGVGIETLRMLAAASRGPSPLPFARVPATQYHFMAQALDAGMLGLMIPMVEDAAQARTIVNSTRYPPVGRRGAGLSMAQDDYERGSTADKIEALNARTFVMAQIESPSGLDNLDAIACVEGIDCLWVGHNDLSIQMGIPGQFQSPKFQDAVQRVADVADRRGLCAGVMVGDLPGAQEWLGKGYRAIAYGADFRLFADALAAGVQGVRDLTPEVQHA
ncbi:MAG: aldolase [Chloroflexi bacterium]|nr:aldolase [Chloroflexota bacterium]